MGQPQEDQLLPGEQDVFLGIGGPLLPKDSLLRDAAFHGHPGEALGLRFRQQSQGIAAKALTEEEAIAGIVDKTISMVINVPNKVNITESEAFRIRRKATDFGLPVMTCMDTAKAFLIAVEVEQMTDKGDYLKVKCL